MWKLTEGQALDHRAWDDEYVVYNDLSGDTHLFGADAMHLLLQLRAGPVDEESLAAALQVDAADREALALTLAELCALSLIERA